jgi:hypothetical protein
MLTTTFEDASIERVKRAFVRARDVHTLGSNLRHVTSIYRGNTEIGCFGKYEEHR